MRPFLASSTLPYLLLLVAGPLASQPGKEEPCGQAKVTLELTNAPPLAALRALGEEAQLDLLLVGLPGRRVSVRLEEVPVDHALLHLADLYGLTCARWRSLVLAEGRPAAPWSERLKAALAPEVAALLLQDRGGRTAAGPGFEYLVEAVRVLYRGQGQTPAGRAALERAVYWMAAPALERLLVRWRALQEGTVLVRFRPHEPDEEDPSTERLYCTIPRPSEEVLVPTQWAVFRGPEWDPFEQELRRQRGIISAGEFRRRVIAAARQTEEPFTDDADLDVPPALRLENVSILEFIASFQKVTKVPVSLKGTEVSQPFTAFLTQTPGRDVLRALARLSGRTLVAVREGYALTAPQVPLEQTEVALPLEVWVYAALTRAERNWLRVVGSRAFWASLSEEEQERLRTQVVPLTELPLAARRTLHLLLLVDLARLWVQWSDNLPTRDSPVPLWLYERPGVSYELASPDWSEFLGGLTYARLKMELTGQKVLRPLRRQPSPPSEGGK